MFFQKILNILKTNIFFIILLITLIFIAYYKVLNIGFFSDDYFWLYRYKTLDFNGFLVNFNDDFFLPISHFFQLVILNLFGENMIIFHLTNILLLFSIGFFLYKTLLKIFDIFSIKNNNLLSKFIVLFFVLSPYNTEVMNWYTAQSYLISTLFFVLAFNYYLKSKINFNYLFLSLLFFILSMLSKEISIVFFPIMIVFELFVFSNKNLKSNFRIILYFTIILSLYFIIRMIFIKNLVGGYGTGVHLNFEFKSIVLSILAYNSKFFGFHRFVSPYFEYYKILILVIYIVIFILVVYLSNKSKSNDFKFFVLIYSFFLISLLPVINLEISFLENIQSDRYGFLPSIFSSILIIYLIWQIKYCHLHLLIFLVLIISSLLLTINTNEIWNNADIFKNRITESASKKIVDNKSIYIITNIPDNYKGVYIFRNGFKEMICMKNKISINNVTIVALQNIYSKLWQNNKLSFRFDTLLIETDNYNTFLSTCNSNNIIDFSPSKLLFIKKDTCINMYYSNNGFVIF